MKTLLVKILPYSLLVLLILVMGTVGFSRTENIPLSDAFYFTIVTVTTVGYGDIHPVTPAGKILSILLIITGVGTFTAGLANGTNFILNRRSERDRIKSINLVVNLFFSEMGASLLARLIRLDARHEDVKEVMKVRPDWKQRDLARAMALAGQHKPDLYVDKDVLEDFRVFLSQNTLVLFRLLENPNLFEHGPFTHLLQAIVHLKDELAHRPDFEDLPEPDMRHLKGDFTRVYKHLLVQYLRYLGYLKDNHPYLLSLAVRTNPFDENASAVVRE